ncbi:hypothetical protein A2U01_0069790, partial [Trifolium medium]|nr:hypothetical protein [Trifolium medium]
MSALPDAKKGLPNNKGSTSLSFAMTRMIKSAGNTNSATRTNGEYHTDAQWTDPQKIIAS